MSLFSQFLTKKIVFSPETVNRLCSASPNQENAFVYENGKEGNLVANLLVKNKKSGDSTLSQQHASAPSPPLPLLKSSPRRVQVKNLSDITLYLPISIKDIEIRDCKGCRVYVGVTERSCTIANCSKCEIFVAAERVSVQTSNDLDLLVYTVQPVSLRQCSSVRVGNYVFFYENQDVHFRQADHFFTRGAAGKNEDEEPHPNMALFSDLSYDRWSKSVRLMTIQEEDLFTESWVKPSIEHKPVLQGTRRRHLQQTPLNMATGLIPRLKHMCVTPAREAQPQDILTVEFELTMDPSSWDWVGLYMLTTGDDESSPENVSAPETRVAFSWVTPKQNYCHILIPGNACPGFYELRYFHTLSPRRSIGYSEKLWIGAVVDVNSVHFTNDAKISCAFTQHKGRRLSPSAWVGLYMIGSQENPEHPENSQYVELARPTFKFYASPTSEGKGVAEFDAPSIAEVQKLSKRFENTIQVHCRVFASAYNLITTSMPLEILLEDRLEPVKEQDDPQMYKIIVSCSENATTSSWFAAYSCNELVESGLSLENRVQWSYIKCCKQVISLERRVFSRYSFLVCCLYHSRSDQTGVRRLILKRNTDTGRIEIVNGTLEVVDVVGEDSPSVDVSRGVDQQASPQENEKLE